MKINEIPEDSHITINISNDEHSIDLDAEVDKRIRNGLLLKPIIRDGKNVNVNNAKVKISLIYTENGKKPIIWRSVAFGMAKKGNIPIIVLSDEKAGVSYNRRNTYRLDMGITGSLNKRERVIIHDISGTGISFYTDKEKAKEIGTEFTLSFTSNYEEITVKGKVVRHQEEENRVLHGCTITPNTKVDNYISYEQIQRARKLRNH